MKRLQTIFSLVILLGLFVSCKPNANMKQLLSKPDTRKEMMDSIANNSGMAKEMIDALISSKNGMVIMNDNQRVMMKINEYKMKTLPVIQEKSMGMNPDLVN
jgi:hypothetical protein